MNRYFLRVCVALTTFVLSIGLTSFTKLFRHDDSTVPTFYYEGPASPLDEMRLRELYREYGPAQARHDRAFFEEVEAEDFILFLGEQHLSREQDIQWMESSPSGVVYESVPDSISILGDWAMVHGRMEARHPDGHAHSWGFIDVWVRRGDTWRIQSTTSVD